MVYNNEHFEATEALRQKAMTKPDQPLQPTTGAEHLLQQPTIDPNEYLSEVFKLYRADEADYRGTRNEEQQFIAEYASEEADEHFDKLVLGIDALRSVVGGTPKDLAITDQKPEDDVRLGDFDEAVTLREMRDSWRQLWVGMNVLTNRLHRDNAEFKHRRYPEIFEMSADNKDALIDQVFSNFQDLNALRFGAKGSGLMRTKRRFDEDMEPVEERFDKDKAQTERQLNENAAKRRYSATSKKSGHEVRTAVHPAGKMTPEEFVGLRKQYPEVDMDRFAYDAAFLKDMAAFYAEQESH